MSPAASYGTVDVPLRDSVAREPPRPHLGSRGSPCSLCIIVPIVALLFFLGSLSFFIPVLVCYTGLGSPPYPHPHGWDSFKNQSFAVGFDLTAGYATAAVAFTNGTIVDIARVEGSARYNQALARLSLKSSVHPTPPYYDCAAQSSDLGRQWLRYFRKRLHVPASTEVAGLIDVLTELKSRTNYFLAPLGPLELAFVTVPNLPALYLEDLVDAAEHVRIQVVTLPGYIFRSGDQAQWPVSEINTAMAGNGVGVDGADEDKPWSDNLLSVLYTDQALTAHVGPFWTATHYFDTNGIANFSLGLARCSVLDQDKHVIASCPASDPYWNRVRQALRDALDSYLSRGRSLGRVISYGEHAHNAQFDALLREEVLARQSDTSKEVQFLSKAHVYAAARGAAHFLQYCTRLPPYAYCFPDPKPKMPGW